MKRQSVCRSEMLESLCCAQVCRLRLWKCQGQQQHLSCSSSGAILPASDIVSGSYGFLSPIQGIKICFCMAEKNYPIKVLYSIFFTPPRWADAAFALRKPARTRGRPVKPHTSARRAPRRGANGCADVRFLTCAAVQPLIFRPEAALGSGFSLQAAFWYQNAMLALFLCSKKSLQRSLRLMPPFRTSQKNWFLCASDVVVATLVAM